MNEWTKIEDFEDGVRGIVSDLEHNGRVDIRGGFGTLQITRTGHMFDVRLYGQGGGFCWAKEWSTTRIESYVSNKTDDPEVCKR